MQVTVALKERGRLAALLRELLQVVRQEWRGAEPDARSLRTWTQLVLLVLVKRTLRLITLGEALLDQRRAHSAKAVAVGLGAWLARVQFPSGPFSRHLLEVIARQVARGNLVTFQGKVLLAIDPTDYPKRSRGRGKAGRQMEHVGKVRKSKKKRKAKGGAQKQERKVQETVTTTSGYTDIWAGLVLRGKQFLPLARQLFSSNHPKLMSQNRVEEAVLAQSLHLLRRLNLKAIVLADRGLGRKELLIKLARENQDFVIRIDPDISIWTDGDQDARILAEVLEAQPFLGEVTWRRGKQGKLHCLVRVIEGTIRYSRSGRKHDYTEAKMRFVQLVPIEGECEPMLLATTFPVASLREARSMAHLYAQRWAIETAFETMKSWGLGRFMVRTFKAIERLLWIVAVAYALAVLVLRSEQAARLREQAVTLLKRLSVVGRRLTLGKLVEAIGLDFNKHRRAWLSVWLT